MLGLVGGAPTWRRLGKTRRINFSARQLKQARERGLLTALACRRKDRNITSRPGRSRLYSAKTLSLSFFEIAERVADIMEAPRHVLVTPPIDAVATLKALMEAAAARGTQPGPAEAGAVTPAAVTPPAHAQ